MEPNEKYRYRTLLDNVVFSMETSFEDDSFVEDKAIQGKIQLEKK